MLMILLRCWTARLFGWWPETMTQDQYHQPASSPCPLGFRCFCSRLVVLIFIWREIIQSTTLCAISATENDHHQSFTWPAEEQRRVVTDQAARNCSTTAASRQVVLTSNPVSTSKLIQWQPIPSVVDGDYHGVAHWIRVVFGWYGMVRRESIYLRRWYLNLPLSRQNEN